jgi:serine/threonine protein kinase
MTSYALTPFKLYKLSTGNRKMASLFTCGQLLRGSLGTYAITRELQSGVWLAKSVHVSQRSCLTVCRNQLDVPVIIKSIKGHPRVANERDVLHRFQHRSACIRPLLDEIVEPDSPTTIVLKHLDDHLLSATIKKTLSSKEIKYVSKRILEALRVLHDDGYVHAGKLMWPKCIRMLIKVQM